MLLDDSTIFHDERYVLECLNIVERIFRGGDYVGGKPGLQRAANFVDPEQSGGINSQRAKGIGGRHTGVHPAVNIADGQSSASLPRNCYIDIGAERHGDAILVSTLQAINPDAMLSPLSAENFKHLIGEFSADQNHVIFFRQS